MDFLNLKNWKITASEENETRLYIHAIYQSQIEKCPHCEATSELLHGNGKKPITVKDLPARGKHVIIKLQIQLYRCKSCKKTFRQMVDEIDEIAYKKRLTKRLRIYIEKLSAEKTFLSISRETGVNENVIRSIFTDYMRETEPKITFPTPRILGIDGVYVKKKDRCIITDIEKNRAIGLYEHTDSYNVKQYLLELENKENVEAVTMDMSWSFQSAVKKILPNAKIVIDKYHVQRMAKKAIQSLLNKIRESLNTSEQKDCLRSPFLLFSRSYNLTEINRKALKKWGRDVPEIAEMYNLKEQFMQIWQFKTREKAIEAFINWRNKIPDYLEFAFHDILTAFTNWWDEIFNYFDFRYTNAFTESINNQIKKIQKETNGCAFYIVRAKILLRSYNKLTEEEMRPPNKPHAYSSVNPKKSQRILLLKQSRQHNSKVFAILAPKEPSWKIRFAPYLHLLHKD